nr:cytochrome c [Halomonas sp. BC04]
MEYWSAGRHGPGGYRLRCRGICPSSRKPRLPGLPAWEGFIEGSLRGDGHGVDTDALAAIADDWEDFESRQRTLIEETATLAELAQGDDFGAMRQQVAAVANTCRGCHDNYRAD